MRLFFAVVTMGLAAAMARGDELPRADLVTFTKAYAAALQSRDVARIESFFLPGELSVKSSSNPRMVERWLTEFKAGVLSIEAPFRVFVQSLQPNGKTSALGEWKAPPQYSIEIMGLQRPKPGHSGAVVESVCTRSGRFYIVRPIPPSRDARIHQAAA